MEKCGSFLLQPLLLRTTGVIKKRRSGVLPGKDVRKPPRYSPAPTGTPHPSSEFFKLKIICTTHCSPIEVFSSV
jgi:hypothetical protein